MKSGVGVEYVKLTNQLQLNGKVEVYLQDMIDSMVSTLRDIATKSFSNYQKMGRREWI
jgi:dynein heavy chain